jgi:hypothetical protein
MKNNECIIYICLPSGYHQIFHKEKGQWWLQVRPNGKTYKVTAEQFLSHLLPALLPDHPATVKVVRIDKPNKGVNDKVE